MRTTPVVSSAGCESRLWAALCVSTHVKTYAYIDGFNLYFRALEAAPSLKWLDVRKMLEIEFKDDAPIDFIWYFTAPIGGRKWQDPDKPLRQKAYFKALRTIDRLDMQFGKYQTYEEWMDLVAPPATGPSRVQVWNTTEKGSDVNLATQLLLDAADGLFEKAIIVSDDSDLLTPIRTVIKRFGKPVDVLTPDRTKPNLELKGVASTFKEIRPTVLALSQFPDEINDTNGRLIIRRPAAWSVDASWQEKLAAIRADLPRQ